MAEARARNESFTLTYRRVSKTGAPFAGRVVTLREDAAQSTRRCTLVVEARGGRGFPARRRRACPPDELALLPPPASWLTAMLLAFPMPMRDDGGELGCIA